MQPDRTRWGEVEGVGGATSWCRHGHSHRWCEPARLAEQITHRLLGYEGKVAGEKQHRIRAVLGCASEAALSGDVLPFLARLDQNLCTQLCRQGGRLVAAGHDQAMFGGTRGAKRAARDTPGKRPPLVLSEGGPQTVLRGLE